MHTLEDQLTSVALQPGAESIVADVNEDLRQCRARRAQVTANISKAIAALGISDRREFGRVSGSEYLRHRMNGRALKFRLRHRLQDHRFERERIDQLYRNIMNGSWQLI